MAWSPSTTAAARMPAAVGPAILAMLRDVARASLLRWSAVPVD